MITKVAFVSETNVSFIRYKNERVEILHYPYSGWKVKKDLKKD